METLIYLAVTSVLFASAALLISGQTARTEFKQAVREVESYITDVANDISAGYYPFSNTSCSHGPLVSSGGELGTSGECIFLGRVFRIAPEGNEQTMDIYTVFGNRLDTPGGEESTSLTEANASVSSKIMQTKQFTDAISIKSVTYNAGTNSTSAFGFVSTLASFEGDTINPGNITTHTIAATGTYTATLPPGPFSLVNNSSIGGGGSLITEDPGEIRLCVQGNATDQYAMITIGAANSSRGIETIINSGDCP